MPYESISDLADRLSEALTENQRLRGEVERLKAQNDRAEEMMNRACVWLDLHREEGITDVIRALSGGDV